MIQVMGGSLKESPDSTRMTVKARVTAALHRRIHLELFHGQSARGMPGRASHEEKDANLATVRDLSRLFRSVTAGDAVAALKAARGIAEQEEVHGHQEAARLLRAALTPNGHNCYPRILNEGAAVAAPLTLLIRELDGPRLRDVKLRRDARRELEGLILEWQHQDVLLKEGVSRRATLVFHGPAGCGKTLTARSLGRELGLPVYTVRLSSVIGAYLGQTGAHLRELFSFAQATPCVLLLDEFDALGRGRGLRDDVAELDRVVVSLLQELDHSKPAGLIIAATNLEKTLDHALWRRFDLAVKFPLPRRGEIKAFVASQLAVFRIRPQRKLLQHLSSCETYAEVDKGIDAYRRMELLRRTAARR